MLPDNLAWKVVGYMDAATRRDLGMPPRRLPKHMLNPGLVNTMWRFNEEGHRWYAYYRDERVHIDVNLADRYSCVTHLPSFCIYRKSLE
jgi:hypothetical protein